MWPPREPTWKPEVVAPPRGSPFVYGDGFNPALRPSNARRRRQEGDTRDARDSGDESDSEFSGSSPEPYMSDYDDDMPLAYTSSRVRRGSEGWEVRPAPGWATGELPPAPLWDPAVTAERPWETPGRYNVYVPGDD